MEGRSDSDRPSIVLSPYLVRQLGVSSPAYLGQTVHADVELGRRLETALTVDVHRQHCRLLVRRQPDPPDGLLRSGGGH